MKKVIIGVSAAVLSAAGTLAILANLTEPSVEAPVEEMQIVSNTEPEITETTYTETYLTTTTTTEYVTTLETTTKSTSLTTETTTSATETSSLTTTVKITTTAKQTTKAVTTTSAKEEKTNPEPIGKSGLTCLGTFKGTYYAGKKSPCKGGSGRTLIDCSVHGQGVKGSVASKYIYNRYKYWVNGRTKVYIECASMPSMTGWYYVDDCCGSSSVIDFYYYRNGNCPFRNAGVISVKVYI